MGDLIGDHKIAFGQGKAGRVLFVDIGALNGRRCLGLFMAKKAGDAEAYSGHVVMTSVDGSSSPEAFPVEFSVKKGQEQEAIAGGLSACVYVADRSLMPSWDGVSHSEYETIQDVTKKIKDFSGLAENDKNKHDPRVVRTGLPYKVFDTKTPLKNDEKVSRKVIIPDIKHLGVRIGEPEPGFGAMAAAKKVAAPAGKVGYGPILAPELDLDAAQDALGAVYMPSSLTVDFYGGAGIPRGVSSDTRMGDRIQAAKSYPVLAEIIANTPDIKRAIDAREPIQQMLIDKTRLTKGALKRLSKVKAPFDQSSASGDERVVTVTDQLGVNRQSKFVVRGTLTLNQAIEHLSELPPDWVPDSDEAWQDFADVLGGLAIPMANITGKSVKDLMSSSKGDWKAFKASLAKAADISTDKFDRAQMSALSGEIMTMIETFARTAVLPMIAGVLKRTNNAVVVQTNPDIINTGLERAIEIAPSLICGKSKSIMAALLEAERRFISRDMTISAIATGLTQGQLTEHTNQLSEEQRKMGDMVGNLAFPVVREAWTASNGYVISPFRNEKEMREEGARMHHCVGSIHAQYGSSGAYHYFSVYHPDTMDQPQQRGTLRIMPISPGSEIKIGEFRSLRNSDVNAACKAAFKEWKESFLQDDLNRAGARMDEWRSFRKERGLNAANVSRTPEQIWMGRIGVQLKDETVPGLLWKEWSENVLSGWPSENPEVMFRSKEVRDLLSTFSPAASHALIVEAEQRKQAETETPAP